MRDEIDARIWNANHDQFSEWIDGGAAALGARLRGSAPLVRRSSPQLVAALAAVGLTLITFTSSVA